MARFCGKCGAPTKPESKFCVKCGAPLIPSAEPPIENTVSGAEEIRVTSNPEETVILNENQKVPDPGETVILNENQKVPDPGETVMLEQSAPEPGTQWQQSAPGPGTQWQQSAPETAPPQAQSGRKKLLKIIIPIAAAVVVIAVAVIIIISVGTKKKYEEAQELYKSKKYEEAGEIFESLGNYEDSAELAEECDNAVAYSNAMSLYKKQDKESVQKAMEIFKGLGKYSSASKMVTDCETRLQEIKNQEDYNAAMALYEAAGDDDEKLQEAADAFAAIEGYDGVEEMVAICKSAIILHEAQKLADKEDWEGALEVLKDYSAAKTDEYNTLYSECNNSIKYENGVVAFWEGRYSDAYGIFSGLGEFKDSADWAAACIQDTPASGEVYHNSGYSRQDSKLEIDNSGYKNTYVKIYCGSDLVSSMFIRENETASIWLPAGTYTMKQAYGDLWFGYDDMFGSDGKYWQCTFGGSETFTIQANYLYTISTSNETGTGVGNTATDPSTF